MASDALGNQRIGILHRQSRRLRVFAWVSLPVLALAYYALIMSRLEPLPKLFALELVYCTPIVLTVVWGLRARSLSEGSERVFWGSMALANGVLFACELLLVWWVVVLSPSGPPRVSWPFHLLHGVAAASFIVAITALTRFSVGSVATRVRWALDTFAVAIVAGVALLELYVHPVMAPAGATTAEMLLGVAYPLLGLLMIVGTLSIIVGFKVERWRTWDRFVIAALFIYAIAISLWPLWFPTAIDTSRNYQRGVLDLVQFCGHWLLMAAAVYRLTEVKEWQLRPLPPIDAARHRWVTAVLPGLLLLAVPAIGYLAYADTAGGRFFGIYVAAFTVLAALALGRSVLIALENGALFHQSVSDPLTGLHNHRYFHDRLEGDLERARRYAEPVSLILLDLDDFSEVNARLGHAEGERLLQEVAGLLRGRCTSDCVLARTGGDDFGIIAPNLGALDAKLMARGLIDQISIGAGPQPGALTASAGVAVFPDHASSADELLRLAQSALYSAKTSGTERVVAHDPHSTRPRGATTRVERMEQESHYWAARSLSAALKVRDSEAALHAADVAHVARAICGQLRLDDSTTWRIEWASHVHGVGLLADTGRWRERQEAPPQSAAAQREVGLSILSSAGLAGLVPVVRALDEHWDGCGEPEGLMGDEIPLEARVVAVAHGYVTQGASLNSSDRVQRALEWTQARSGVDFDPDVVDALEATLSAAP